MELEANLDEGESDSWQVRGLTPSSKPAITVRVQRDVPDFPKAQERHQWNRIMPGLRNYMEER